MQMDFRGQYYVVWIGLIWSRVGTSVGLLLKW
jgi:hypothetical protein